MLYKYTLQIVSPHLKTKKIQPVQINALELPEATEVFFNQEDSLLN